MEDLRHTRGRPVPGPASSNAHLEIKGDADHSPRIVTYRPVGNEWLETKTKYGFSETLFPVTLRGTLEFDMKTPNVRDESAVILGEYDSALTQGGLIQIGIAFEKFYYGNLDNPPVAVEDEIYNVRISWDGSQQTYRVWIDGVPQKKEGSYDIPIPFPGPRASTAWFIVETGPARLGRRKIRCFRTVKH